jgi:hypothetical protein
MLAVRLRRARCRPDRQVLRVLASFAGVLPTLVVDLDGSPAVYAKPTHQALGHICLPLLLERSLLRAPHPLVARHASIHASPVGYGTRKCPDMPLILPLELVRGSQPLRAPAQRSAISLDPATC